MSVRDLMPFSRTSVPISRESNPMMAFQDEMNRLFSDFFGETFLPSWWRGTIAPSLSFSPAIDISKGEKELRITAEIPGLDSKDVHISAADGYITIKGEKSQESKEEQDGYVRQERSFGSFHRTIPLPDTADTDKAEASFKNGVLTLHIPNKAGAASKQRKIEIKS